MKCRQYNIKVFEIGVDDENTFIEFMEANSELLKNHLISVRGSLPERAREFMRNRGMSFVENMELPKGKGGGEFCISSITGGSTPTVSETSAQPAEEEDIYGDRYSYQDPPLMIVEKALRSGQYIEYDGSVLLMERMNSGAKVAALGSVIALNRMEGDISSVGDCIVVPSTKRGNILFHGRKIENDMLKYGLNRISFVNDEIVIQPLSKKEFI